MATVCTSPVLRSFLLTALLVSASCRRSASDPPASSAAPLGNGLAQRGCAPGAAAGFDPAIDYFPRPRQAEFLAAENVEVSYHRYFKVVRLRNGQSGSGEDFPETLVLVRCGAAPPLAGDLAGAAVVPVPVGTVATNAVSDLARLRELGLAGRVVGMPGGAVYDEDFHRRWLAGELVSIGQPGHGQPDLEVLLDAAPDLVLLFNTGPEHAAGLARARELGLRAAPSYAFTEKTYLGQAEWLKYVALFFDAEEEANASFAAMAGRYRELSRRAREAAREHPKTAIWGGSAGGNRWWTESSGPAAGLIEDAGATNLLADSAAGPFATLETAVVLDRAAGADLWITSAVDESEWDERLPLSHFRAYREGRVFHNRRRFAAERNASDWNETALVQPDRALADLVFLLHPELLPGHQLSFFAPLARREGKP